MQLRSARRFTELVAGVCSLVVFTTSLASAQSPPVSPKLADYFGFLPLELYKLETRISNLTLRDLDGDKTDDIIVSNNARSRIDLLLSSKKPDEAAARPFRTNVNDLEYDRRMRLVSIPVNKEVVSVDTGDFNGDGKLDLVYYGTPAEVQILFNEGDGRFSAPRKINSGEAIERGNSLTVGDFDQDGRDDLALLGEKELIFVYQTAPGTLGEPERLPHTVSGPWLIKAVDLDGNGARDLAVFDTESDHPIHVRFATEEKKLGPEQRFASEPPRAVAFGQVDGQGGWELLTIEGSSSRAKVLTLDSSGTGDSDKRGRLAYFALPQGNERGRSLSTGDVNGDGRADVVVSEPASAQVIVYLQTASAGLNSGQTFPSLVGGKTVRVAATEKGKKADVFILSEQEKQIGRASLENGRLSFPTPLPTVGDPVAMDVAQATDGKGLRIYYVTKVKPADSTKGGADTFELRLLTADANGQFQPVKLGAADFVAIAGLSSAPAGLETLDVNHDGATDFLIFNDYGSPVLLIGQKDGAPGPFVGSLGPLAAATRAGLSTIALNGPALLVAQNTFARRILLDSKRHWTITDQYNAGRTSAQIVGAAALDTDGDGVKEVVLLDRSSKSLLFLSLKDSVYRPSGQLAIGSINFDGMHVADFDGDGKDDLLIAGTDKFAVLQSGRKGLRLKTLASFEPKRTETKLADLAVGDVNDDGAPDVVFSDIGEQSLDITSYVGDKELLQAVTFKIFERKTFRNVGDLIEPRDMAIGDVDGDGRADIVLIVHDRVVVYRQDPGKTPGKPDEKAAAK
jgi:hypothetical protein